MNQVVSAIIGVIATLFGLMLSPGLEPAASAATTQGYIYDSQLNGAASTHPISERGPPATYDRDINQDADDHRPRDAATRPSGPTTRDTNGYDASATLSRVNNSAGTTREPAAAITGDLSSFRGGRVAAKTGSCACSFVGATTVLVAHGTRRAIEEVRVGDKVIATDPETGEQEDKVVEHVVVQGDTDMDLVVDGEVITTTEDHPFWSVTEQRFERADQLAVGEEVLGADGRVITVSGLKVGTEHRAQAYDLEIEGIHTYHVGDSEILVHNVCPSIPGNPFRGPDAPKDAFAHLKKNHGLDPAVANNRLHVIKRDAGVGAADDVVIGRTGDVYDARTGELLDTLTNPGLGVSR